MAAQVKNTQLLFFINFFVDMGGTGVDRNMLLFTGLPHCADAAFAMTKADVGSKVMNAQAVGGGWVFFLRSPGSRHPPG